MEVFYFCNTRVTIRRTPLSLSLSLSLSLYHFVCGVSPWPPAFLFVSISCSIFMDFLAWLLASATKHMHNLTNFNASSKWQHACWFIIDKRRLQKLVISLCHSINAPFFFFFFVFFYRQCERLFVDAATLSLRDSVALMLEINTNTHTHLCAID